MCLKRDWSKSPAVAQLSKPMKESIVKGNNLIGVGYLHGHVSGTEEEPGGD